MPPHTGGYNVSDIGQFIAALTSHATPPVVLEVNRRCIRWRRSTLWLEIEISRGFSRGHESPTAADVARTLSQMGLRGKGTLGGTPGHRGTCGIRKSRVGGTRLRGRW